MIVRIRMVDGSMEKVQIPNGAENTMTLSDLLKPFTIPPGSSIQKSGSGSVSQGGPQQEDLGSLSSSLSLSTTLNDLGVKHGSLLTIIGPTITTKTTTTDIDTAGAPSSSSSSDGTPDQSSPSSQRLKSDPNRWDPFPELAKHYEHALLQTKIRRSSQRVMSYGDIAKLQSSLHTVEPQTDGRIKRLYMCQLSAERFHANGVITQTKKKDSTSSTTTSTTGTTSTSDPMFLLRTGLLLGTIQRERVDKDRPKRARTSLSSQVSDDDYCTVAKVQAIWERPSSSSSAASSSSSIIVPTNPDTSQSRHWYYDRMAGQQLLEENPRIVRIASALGLIPIGWIFTYHDARHKDPDALPMLGRDVVTGAKLQISNMKLSSSSSSSSHQDGGNWQAKEDGAKFVTCAMDATTGATEAFQLSDVSVQMVAEGMLLLQNENDDGNKHDTNGKSTSTATATSSSSSVADLRHVPTKHPILVDEREINTLDSVLCLINTAMLRHVGSFAGKTMVSSIKRNGNLTTKTKKTLLAALQDEDDPRLLQELCNFSTIVALDQALSEEETEELCQLVHKWARGRKLGTTVGSQLKRRLQSILETY